MLLSYRMLLSPSILLPIEEKLAIYTVLEEIENKYTTKLVYPLTEVLNLFSPRREITHVCYTCKNRALIANKHTSEFKDATTIVLDSLSLRREVSYSYRNRK